MRCSRRFSILFFVCLFLSALFSSVYAQDSEREDWYLEKNITKISFTGLNHVKVSELSGITASYIGRTVGSCIYDLLDRLYALELFDDIEPGAAHDRGDGVIVTFKVVEKPVINAIRFKGNRKVRNAPLREALTIKTGDIYMEAKVLVDERAVRDVYLDKGYKDVKVSYETTETPDGIDVTYIIKEGNSTAITEINFVGNTVVSSKKLKSQCKMKTASLIRKGAFQESVLENDRQAITKFYYDRGYLDFNIIDITRDVSKNEKKDRDDMVVTYYLYEGNQYTFDQISFNGNKVFSTERLLSLMKLKQGDVFNVTKFNESVMGITDLYYENGYTENGFSPAENRDTMDMKVSYVINITERDRSHVEKVIVKGNTKTKEYVITRELPIESGDVFSKAKIKNGLRNLYNLQYFSAVVPSVEPGSEQNLVDIVLTVEEQMTNSIEFGVTFSGVRDPKDLPFAVFVKWQNSNLFGTGRTLSASTTLSALEQSVSLGYQQNWIFDLPIEWSESISFSHSQSSALRVCWQPDGTTNSTDYYMDYDAYSFSLNSSLGHRWMPNFAILTLSGGLTNSILNYIYDDALYQPVSTQISEYANNWGFSNSIWTKFSMDGRDINYDPSKGWFFSQQLSWYGLTPVETDFYLRTDTKLEGYVPLINIPVTEKWSLKLILAAYTGFSFQIPAAGSGVSESNKLYIDGMFNGRGWTKIYNTVKGRSMISNRLELRFPVVPGIVALDGFFDAAAVKRTPADLFDIKPEDWYFSCGPDIRFLIPQFPMRLMLANTFRIEDGEAKWKDTWQFVLSFNVINK